MQSHVGLMVWTFPFIMSEMGALGRFEQGRDVSPFKVTTVTAELKSDHRCRGESNVRAEAVWLGC